jgi:hypothetical protein
MTKHISHSIHEAAPELLLDKIAELNSILAKYQGRNTSSDQMKFYSDLLKVMRFAYAYMMDTKYMHERNILLEDNVRWLSENNHNLRRQIDEFNTILRLQCQGRLDEVIQQAGQYTDHVLTLKKMNNDTHN